MWKLPDIVTCTYDRYVGAGSLFWWKNQGRSIHLTSSKSLVSITIFVNILNQDLGVFNQSCSKANGECERKYL